MSIGGDTCASGRGSAGSSASSSGIGRNSSLGLGQRSGGSQGYAAMVPTPLPELPPPAALPTRATGGTSTGVQNTWDADVGALGPGAPDPEEAMSAAVQPVSPEVLQVMAQ